MNAPLRKFDIRVLTILGLTLLTVITSCGTELSGTRDSEEPYAYRSPSPTPPPYGVPNSGGSAVNTACRRDIERLLRQAFGAGQLESSCRSALINQAIATGGL